MENNYSKAYKEVIVILNYVPKESVAKIPKTMIDTFKAKMDKNYDFKIDVNKSFKEQDILDETKAIFANIFKDYWATESQREKILATQKYLEEELENEKKRKYNSDNLIKNINKQNYTKIQKNEVALVEYKESFFTRFKNFILKLFSRKS